jgi:predicted dienelactone hydrolase
MLNPVVGLSVALAAAARFCAFAGAHAYDPLRLPAAPAPAATNLTVRDAERGRDVPVRVYLPAATNAAPVVLFSHGLGGSRENSPYLGSHWSARGYAVVFVQHPGSDESVWKGQPARGERLQAMREAASAKNFALRVKDIPAVLDQLTRWNGEKGHPLFGRLDLSSVGMCGHSFGAITTQAVSGQRFPLGIVNYTDGRIKAAVAFSPSAPKRGSAERAFGGVAIPWLLMTGTKDTSFINDTDVASRLEVFPALPPGRKYELVLEGAEHSAFGDRPLPGDREARNPNHHRAILALSTAFWDAYLRGDGAAQNWLDGAGARGVLEPKDRWQKK